eukprot:1142212-Pelagomonas_calceolata.AAC.6
MHVNRYLCTTAQLHACAHTSRNEKLGAGSSKRKPGAEQGFAGDAAPHNMLMNTLMPPRVRQP